MKTFIWFASKYDSDSFSRLAVNKLGKSTASGRQAGAPEKRTADSAGLQPFELGTLRLPSLSSCPRVTCEGSSFRNLVISLYHISDVCSSSIPHHDSFFAYG